MKIVGLYFSGEGYTYYRKKSKNSHSAIDGEFVFFTYENLKITKEKLEIEDADSSVYQTDDETFALLLLMATKIK